MEHNHFLFHLLFIFSIFTISTSQAPPAILKPKKFRGHQEQNQEYRPPTSPMHKNFIAHQKQNQVCQAIHNKNAAHQKKNQDDLTCEYTVYVKTKNIIKGGTDSIISLTLYDAKRHDVRINNLESWGGLKCRGYDYFEKGNLDIFHGRGRCLQEPVCSMNLTSDGSGSDHEWYCSYVEVTTTGVHQQCIHQKFTVKQWLATDAKSYKLTAIRDNCYYPDDSKRIMYGSDVQ